MLWEGTKRCKPGRNLKRCTFGQEQGSIADDEFRQLLKISQGLSASTSPSIYLIFFTTKLKELSILTIYNFSLIFFLKPIYSVSKFSCSFTDAFDTLDHFHLLRNFFTGLLGASTLLFFLLHCCFFLSLLYWCLLISQTSEVEFLMAH